MSGMLSKLRGGSGQGIRIPLIALLVGCAGAGALVGTLIPSTREVDQPSFVVVNPQNPLTLQRAGILDIRGGKPKGVLAERFRRGTQDLRGQRIAGVTLAVAGGQGASGLRRALTAAYDYIQTTTRLQDRELEERLAGASPRSEPARVASRVLASRSERFNAAYSVRPGSDSSAPARGAMLGLLVGALILSGSRLGGAAAPRPRRLTLIPPWPWLRTNPVAVVGVGALAAGLAGLLVGVGPARSYTLIAGLLAGGAAVAFALRGERAVRWLLGAVIVLAPFRGAVLSLLQTIGAPGADLMMNAIQPTLVVAGAAGVIAMGRDRFRSSPPLLVLGISAIAVVCALNALTQEVGLTIWAIGLAQYLIYPLFALVLWQVMRPGDGVGATTALIWLGIAVSITVLLDYSGLVTFAQSVSGEGAGTARYGGSTGSFIHASIFLGTAIPILAGWLISQRSRGRVMLGAAGLAALLAGLALTFGRAGVGIAAIGMALLFLASEPRIRLRMLVVALVALAIAVPASWAAGRPPGVLADRIAGVVDPKDPGNEARIRGQENALRNWRDASVPQQLFGEGLASTGNARKLAALGSRSPESYALKLLVETGVVGLLLIGGVLVWTAAVFLRLCFSEGPLVAKGVGAAGFGLFIDGFFYQTLEVQLIGMTWWLLLVVALRERLLERP